MGNKFLSARNEIDELLQEKKEILEKASNVVARVSIDMNEKGIVDNIITDNIKKLINGFTVDEQNEILVLAMKKVIINL